MSRMRDEDVLHASFTNHVFEVSVKCSVLFCGKVFEYLSILTSLEKRKKTQSFKDD